MSTAAQIAANRLNAQKSTGPRTAEGKAASSKGNFRHGLRGAFLVLPNEDEDEFDDLLASLRDEHNPTTQTEEILVQQMAEHFWLTRRAKGFQDTMILNPETFTIKMMTMWLRYETQHQRAFHKCLNDLLKLRAERRKEERDAAALSQRAEDLKNGFERKTRQAEAHAVNQRVKIARAEALERHNSIPATVKISKTELNNALKTAFDSLTMQKAA